MMTATTPYVVVRFTCLPCQIRTLITGPEDRAYAEHLETQLRHLLCEAR